MMEITAAPAIDDDFLRLVLDHCKIDAGDPEDLYADPGDADLVPLIEHYVEAAVGRVEACSGRRLFKQSLRLTVDGFGRAIELPASPVIAVTKVEYLDAQGGLQTLPSGDYALIDRLGTPKLIPAHGHSWPATASSRHALRPVLAAAKRSTPHQSVKKALVLKKDKKSRKVYPTHLVGGDPKNPDYRLLHLLEFGTDPHPVNHPGTDPQPFLTPAFEAEGQNAIKRFGERLGPAVEKQAARLAKKYGGMK